MSASERYVAPHDMPGFAAKGDGFIYFPETGEVYSLQKLGPGATARFHLNRPHLRPPGSGRGAPMDHGDTGRAFSLSLMED